MNDKELAIELKFKGILLCHKPSGIEVHEHRGYDLRERFQFAFDAMSEELGKAPRINECELFLETSMAIYHDLRNGQVRQDGRRVAEGEGLVMDTSNAGWQDRLNHELARVEGRDKSIVKLKDDNYRLHQRIEKLTEVLIFISLQDEVSAVIRLLASSVIDGDVDEQQ